MVSHQWQVLLLAWLQHMLLNGCSINMHSSCSSCSLYNTKSLYVACRDM